MDGRKDVNTSYSAELLGKVLEKKADSKSFPIFVSLFFLLPGMWTWQSILQWSSWDHGKSPKKQLAWVWHRVQVTEPGVAVPFPVYRASGENLKFVSYSFLRVLTGWSQFLTYQPPPLSSRPLLLVPSKTSPCSPCCVPSHTPFSGPPF